MYPNVSDLCLDLFNEGWNDADIGGMLKIPECAVRIILDAIFQESMSEAEEAYYAETPIGHFYDDMTPDNYMDDADAWASAYGGEDSY